MKEFFSVNEFFSGNSVEIVKSIITLVVLILFQMLSSKAIRKVGKIGDFNEVRTRLIIKYVNISIFFIAIGAGSFIWSVNFKDLGLLLSSVFAVLGVALFAQWSILSNVTSGIILFFSFPFKIGDRIRIQDKDFPLESQIVDIKAFYVFLRTDEGELMTYPNNLLLQKGVVIIDKQPSEDDSYTPDDFTD
ncbi:mechanosensitive ion channel domain-containing protein [Ascidiimonas aurantiaca]|uniref:mechanosensitive ion channel domain-containing protein n=1 Tax=Ascidiimonas aurantiaca TaxID=1685432 RepID=UPI0030EE3205